jgi:hypothetical protein
VIGRTVDAKIGATPGRVTLLSEQTLRIEPDDSCRIIAATAEDGRMTICAIGRRNGPEPVLYGGACLKKR